MESPPKIRILLVDDHRFIHDAVSLVLNATDDMALVAQGGNGQEAVQLCQEFRPDLILMDVVMPVMNGVDATRIIHQQYPAIRILVLSSFHDDESVRAMLEYGAVGYILKDSIAHDLVNTIRTIYSGNIVFSPEIASTLLTAVHPRTQDFGLTHRELEVLRRMAEGLNNGEIAADLTISPSTVKFHINNLIHKMGVRTRSEAIVLAARNDLI